MIRLENMPDIPPRYLSELAAGITEPGIDVEIHGISDDSRDIRPNEAFLCLPRTGIQASEYIQAAKQAGAAAIITIGEQPGGTELPVLKLPGMSAAGQLLRRWFGTETTSVKLVGITGTDGKTSVSWMLRQALAALQGSTWALGTLGWIKDADDIVPLGNTTPSLLTMHQLLAMAEAAGVGTLICEVSSHGIAQQRIAGLDFDVAVWTNLGHDHLHDHGGFEAYATIKAGFLRQVAACGGLTICNADDPEVMARAPEATLSYGHGLYREGLSLAWEQELPGMLRLQPTAAAAAAGSAGKIAAREICIEDIPLGDFHAENLAAVALVLGVAFDVWAPNLTKLLTGINTPPGRLQPVNVGPWQVFIDYAHTPEALERCLKAARRLTHHRLLTVFGCGGNRDHEKRPHMGAIAAQLADVMWITSDNPREEMPEVIAAEIADGIDRPCPAEVHLQLDRKAAIREAIEDMKHGDVLVIAGKGVEPCMEIGGHRLPWSDEGLAAGAMREKNDHTVLQACA